MEPSLAFWLSACVATFFVGMSKGGFPMVGMLAVPILSIFMSPAIAAGLILPIFIVSDVYAIWLYRRDFSAPNLKVLIPAGVMGIIFGYLTVSVVSDDFMKLVVAVIGVVFLADLYRKRLLKKVTYKAASTPRGLFWGTLAGYTSYIAHAGGPPFQAYVLPQKLDKLTFVGTSTMMFAVVNALKVPPYIMAGQMGWDSLMTVIYLVPLAVAGAWTGHWVVRRLPERFFFVFVEVALFAVSAKLLWDVLGPA